MRTLLVACGNSLRRDDGVAAAVLQLVAPAPDRELRVVHQLTPEIAEDIAGFERVVFLDADAAIARVMIEPVRSTASCSPLTHVLIPAEIIAISRALFGFAGAALLCRIPAHDFSAGENPAPHALQLAKEAADTLRSFL